MVNFFDEVNSIAIAELEYRAGAIPIDIVRTFPDGERVIISPSKDVLFDIDS